MMMRPQHNNNKNRSRGRNNRGRHNGGGGGGGGNGGNYNGNPANRVFDSNGPDVKLRGTAQTIAEKYMQLGRDAHSAGDGVMAESYFQHGEHYYRLWLANQPAGQPINFPRRPGQDDEYEDDMSYGSSEQNSNDADDSNTDSQESDNEPAGADAQEGQDQPRQQQQQQPRPPREFRDNPNNDRGPEQNRDGGNKRDRFRSRWPRRNERNGDSPRDEQQNSFEREAAPAVAETPTNAAAEAVADANWEAPSFLMRPIPVVVSDHEPDIVPEPAAPVRVELANVEPVRRPRGRPARVAAPAPSESDGE